MKIRIDFYHEVIEAGLIETVAFTLNSFYCGFSVSNEDCEYCRYFFTRRVMNIVNIVDIYMKSKNVCY